MNLNDWRHIFFITYIFSLILIFIPLVNSIFQDEPHQFISLSILDENREASDYFPSNNEFIQIGDEINWFYSVQNSLGSLQYITLKIKLLNSTHIVPDSINCEPSSLPVIYEENFLIKNNMTLTRPFNWTINKINLSSNIILYEIKINNYTKEFNLTSIDDDFRFIFELWTYDVETNRYVFTWQKESEKHCVWNMIWFKLDLNL